jgi:hypothetical protein
MAQCPFKLGQYAHIVHGICSPFLVGIIKRQAIIGYTMQPVPFATDIDAGFIGMCQIRSGQLIFDPIFKIYQRPESFFVKIENRSFTDRYMKLIGKIVLYSVMRDKLKL